jgi:hypothetical protein
MGWSRLGLVGAPSDLDGSRQCEQLEPGQGVPGGAGLCHTPFRERSECAKRGRWMPGVHGSGGSAADMELRRRVVSVAALAGAPFGGDDALLLEVADHPGRYADRLTGGPDPRRSLKVVVVWIAWHATESTTTLSHMRLFPPSDVIGAAWHRWRVDLTLN